MKGIILAGGNGTRLYPLTLATLKIALRMGFISAGECHALGAGMRNSPHGQYVMEVARTFTG